MSNDKMNPSESSGIVGPCAACQPAREAGARFCPDCGASLLPPSPPAGAALTPPVPFVAATPAAVQAVAATPAATGMPSAGQPVGTRPAAGGPNPTPASGCACGAVLGEDARFCPRCGKPAPQAQGSNPAVMPMSAANSGFQLVCCSPGNRQVTVLMGSHPLVVGKTKECDLTIMDDDYVSRRHLQITPKGGQILLEDLNSSNGSFLRVRRPIALETGDEIVVGETVLRIEQVRS